MRGGHVGPGQDSYAYPVQAYMKEKIAGFKVFAAITARNLW